MISKNSVCLHVRGGDFKYIKSNNILDEKYYKTAFKLSNAFRLNFKKFERYASEEIRRGGPQRYAL